MLHIGLLRFFRKEKGKYTKFYGICAASSTVTVDFKLADVKPDGAMRLTCGS